MSDEPTRTAARHNPFVWAWTAALAAATAAVTVHPEFESDPFWLMTLARAVLAHGSRVVPEPAALPAFTDPAVVPEWLWGVVLLALHRVGPTAIAAFVALVAVAACASVIAMLREIRPAIGKGALAAISGGIAAVLLIRLRTRPEAAGLVLLPAFIVASARFCRAPSARGGALLAILEVLWAQLHGSFVLAPVAFVAIAIGQGRALLGGDASRASTREKRILVGATLGALVAGLATSAFGLHLGDYLFGHATGDAGRHIVDWMPLRWEDFAPRDWLSGPHGGPYGAVCAVMLGASLMGMVAARRVFVAELVLALFGVALMATGCRFLTFGCILAGPLAAAGLDELAALVPTRRLGWLLGGAFGLAMVGFQAHDMHVWRGPLGRVGLAEGDFPLSATAYLWRSAQARPGAERPLAVLSSYDAGGPLAFWLPGIVRTYVDGRTPLYFDGTDYAVSRDVLGNASAMGRALTRYDAEAVVIGRDAGACPSLASAWAAVSIEPRFTTFVPRDRAGTAALTALAACGPAYLREDACRDGGHALDEDLDRLAGLRASPFVDYLRAERVLRCGGDLAPVGRLIPARSDARSFRADRDRAAAVFEIRSGRLGPALDVIEDSIRDGDLASLAIALPVLSSEKTPVARARVLLDAAVEKLDDRTPPDVRAILAVACAEERDAECARFEALRAAAGGSKLAVPTLSWLAREHPSARARADAEAWLSVLRAPAPPASAAPAAPAAATAPAAP